MPKVCYSGFFILFYLNPFCFRFFQRIGVSVILAQGNLAVNCRKSHHGISCEYSLCPIGFVGFPKEETWTFLSKQVVSSSFFFHT